MARKSDSIDKAPYRIGYSFKSPNVVKRIAHQRDQPFFAMSWAGKGPTDVQKDFWESGKTRRFPTVWRRAAMSGTVSRLGGVRHEMPSFDELGAAPGPTETSASGTIARNDWGSLLNTITSVVGEGIQQQQQLQLVKAQVAAQKSQYSGMFPNIQVMPSSDGSMGLLGWGAIALGVGAVGYYVMNR